MTLDTSCTLSMLPTEPLRALRAASLLVLVALLCLSAAHRATAKDTHPQLMLQKMVNSQDYNCLSAIIMAESAWNPHSISPTQDYGLPQRHMPHHTQKQIKAWLSDTHKQLTWMIAYTKQRYGSPCQAAQARDLKGWY